MGSTVQPCKYWSESDGPDDAQNIKKYFRINAFIYISEIEKLFAEVQYFRSVSTVNTQSY